MSEKTWTQLWLEYRKVNSRGNEVFCKNIILEGFDSEHPMVKNALKELALGVQEMLDVEVSVQPEGNSLKEPALYIKKQVMTSEDAEGAYRLAEKNGELVLCAGEESGVLYGVFHILRMIATEQSLQGIDIQQEVIVTLLILVIFQTYQVQEHQVIL